MSETTVTLDVRETIRSGREPFGPIMQAVAGLDEGQKLLLIAPFEPVPLYGVMAQRGFDYEANEREGGAWEVLFSRVGGETAGAAARPPCSRMAEVAVLEIDARHLEPPEPLVRILEEVANLLPGTVARAYTDRRPVHLLTQLEERGLTGESEEQPDGSFVTVIQHR